MGTDYPIGWKNLKAPRRKIRTYGKADVDQIVMRAIGSPSSNGENRPVHLPVKETVNPGHRFGTIECWKGEGAQRNPAGFPGGIPMRHRVKQKKMYRPVHQVTHAERSACVITEHHPPLYRISRRQRRMGVPNQFLVLDGERDLGDGVHR
jgi:hypothetical protein